METQYNDLEMLRYLAKTDKKIAKLYKQITDELAALNIPYDSLPAEDIFNFVDYPNISRKLKKAMKEYEKSLTNIVREGIYDAINMSYFANALAIKNYPIYTLDQIGVKQHRENCQRAFMKYRMEPKEGLNLSQRVWNYTQQTKGEFEVAISDILSDGIKSRTSAEELGRMVRDRLNNPDMMYRRYHEKRIRNGKKEDVVYWRRKVVDEEGKVHFVKQTPEHVGQGVYRSSRQNALRMTATEINMAYRYADNYRWKSQPFVLGFRIVKSKNHPLVDICDDLAGDYPKDFLWTGWHPRCRCHAESILVSKDEMREMSFLSEKDYQAYKPKGLVTKMPDKFNQWLEENKTRIIDQQKRGKLPYFLRDNQRLLPKNTPPIDYTALQIKVNGINNPLMRQKMQARYDDAFRIKISGENAELASTRANELSKGIERYMRLQVKKESGLVQSSWNSRYPEPILPFSEKFEAEFKHGAFSMKVPQYVGANPLNNEFEKHVNELVALQATDPKAIIDAIKGNWRVRWNEVAQRVMNDKKIGSDSEFLYNIYKLSTIQIPKPFSLSNISPNMPYNIFTEYIPRVGEMMMPKKEFFDMLGDKFVPLKVNTMGTGAFYSPAFKYVDIGVANKSGGLERFCKENSQHRISVLYHEYGHALDDAYSLSNFKTLVNLLKQQKKMYNTPELEVALRRRIAEYVNKSDAFKTKYNDCLEQIGVYTDTMQAIVKSHKTIHPMGHSSTYMGKVENQMAEVIAHCFELKYSDNQEFRNLDISLYNKMLEALEKALISEVPKYKALHQ